MSEIVFLLEEPSAQELLEGLLPRLLPTEIPIRYIVFEGKQDLDRQLVRRLRGYRVADAWFVILRDQDSSDCRALKQDIRRKCNEANRPNVLIRIACHELESWYLADLHAVSQGLKIRDLDQFQNQAKYRFPDDLANAAQELRRLTKDAYQKIAGSRAIGPLLNLDNTRSHSFRVFVSGMKGILSRAT